MRIILVHDVIIAVICITRFIIIATVDILVQPKVFAAFRSPFECLRLAVELVRQGPRRGLVDPLLRGDLRHNRCCGYPKQNPPLLRGINLLSTGRRGLLGFVITQGIGVAYPADGRQTRRLP